MLEEILGKIESEEIRTQVSEKFAELENTYKSQVNEESNKAARNAYNNVELVAKEMFGIEKNANEKASDYLKRAAKEHYEPKINKYESKVSEYEAMITELKTGGASAGEKQLILELTDKIKKIQGSYIELENKFNTTLTEKETTVSTLENKYKEEINNLRKENIYNRYIPQIHESYLKDPIFKRGAKLMTDDLTKQFEKDYEIIQNESGEYVGKHYESGREVDIAKWFSAPDKLGEYLKPKSIVGNDAGSVVQKGQNGTLLRFNKDMTVQEASKVIREYLTANGFKNTLTRGYEEAFKKQLEAFYKIKQ